MTNEALHPDLFLARRALRGDPRAWEDIVERYGRRIFNLCLQFAGAAPEAEDLTQEIFLKIHGNLGQYRGEVPLAAWVLRLARNLCIDQYRRHRLRKESEVHGEDALLERPSPLGDPAADLQKRERRRLVRGVLREMPVELAEVVMLRDLQGLSYDEVTSALEVPLGTVKSRLYRARRELVSRVEERLGLGGVTGGATAPISREVRSC